MVLPPILNSNKKRPERPAGIVAFQQRPGKGAEPYQVYPTDMAYRWSRMAYVTKYGVDLSCYSAPPLFPALLLRPVQKHLLHMDRSLPRRFLLEVSVGVRCGLAVGMADDLHGHQRVDAALVAQHHVVVPEAMRGQRRLDLLENSVGAECARLGRPPRCVATLRHHVTTKTVWALCRIFIFRHFTQKAIYDKISRKIKPLYTIETNYELPASKTLYLRDFQSSKKWIIAEKCRQFVHYSYTTYTPIFLQNR